jgi:beta-galactosidase
VARAIDDLALPTLACDPDGVFATVHEDDAGVPRVLFLMNPGAADVVARVTVISPQGVSAVAQARDVIDDQDVTARAAGEGRALVEARMKPRTVRMLALR